MYAAENISRKKCWKCVIRRRIFFDVLDMSVDRAFNFSVMNPMLPEDQPLHDVGLGYVNWGNHRYAFRW